MNKDVIKEIMNSQSDLSLHVIKDVPYSNYGYRLKLKNGIAIICYNKNNYRVIGGEKKRVQVQAILDQSYKKEPNKNVFIVYGRDDEAKTELKRVIEKWDLVPITIDDEPVNGRTIIESLEKYIPDCNCGVVLLTPDDTGYLCGHEFEKRTRPRQNVVLELGMLIMKFGRGKIILLQKNDQNMELPSDIAGILCIRYEKSISEIITRLHKELESLGYFN